MSKKTQSVREVYEDLTSKAEQLKSLRDERFGQLEEKKKQRADVVADLKELGVKNPDDLESVKEHVSELGKKLVKVMRNRIGEIDNAIEQIGKT